VEIAENCGRWDGILPWIFRCRIQFFQKNKLFLKKHLTNPEECAIIYNENKADTLCGSPFDDCRNGQYVVPTAFVGGMICGECRHVSALIFVLNFNAWGCPQ
jgi:hypothetical protein